LSHRINTWIVESMVQTGGHRAANGMAQAEGAGFVRAGRGFSNDLQAGASSFHIIVPI